MKPYIAINAATLYKEKRTGVEWYTFQLLKYLEREWKQDDPRVVLFTPFKINFPKNKWGIKILPGKFLWTQYHLLKFLKRYPPALLFSPSYVAPRFLPRNIPTINVVHGLEGEYFPEFRTIGQILSDYFLVKPTLQKSSAIIAVSEHTKKDLNHFYGILLDKIQTILSGPGTLDDGYTPPSAKAEYPSPEGTRFLFLGGVNERKNLGLAIKIFVKLRSASGQKMSLSIAGNAKDENLLKDINLLVYVSEKEKIEQLKSAHFLLYPSFYEGFGFPVLEAQRCGAVPVVLKNSGLDEAGGKGVIEYDPTREKESISRITSYVENQKKYQDILQTGLKNAQKYSWQKCAIEVKKVLLQVINNQETNDPRTNRKKYKR